MGWNAGYGIFEETVIGVYNLGKLDQDVLSVIMESYRGANLDRDNGENFTAANDGKDAEQIVIETFRLTMPEKPDLPEDAGLWSLKQWDADDKYYEETAELFWSIAKGKFGW